MSDGNNKDFIIERAEAALISRDFNLAARLYKSVLKDDLYNKSILLKLGTCYVRANQDEKALEPYLRVLALDNNNFEALNNLGGIYRRLGKYEESVKVLEAALKLGINSEEVNYNLGHTYKLMGHYDAAADSFYSVIDENPNDVLAYNHLGTIQAARGEYKKALQTYWRALQIDPNHPVLHFNSALSFTALGQYEDAINSYENVLRTKPGWIEALESYISLLIKQKNYKKAEETLNSAIQVYPNNVNFLNSSGKIFYRRGLLDKSEEEYKKAKEIDDKNFDTLNGLAKIYEKLSRYTEAAPLLNILETLAENEEIRNKIINRQISLLIQQNKLKDAATLLKKARAKDPDNVEIINLLAQFFIQSRERKKEKSCYQLIKSLNPNYVNYLRDCGIQHNKIGNLEEASKLLEKYLAVNPKDVKALTAYGYTLESKTDYERALKTYQTILELEPENTLALGAISKIGQETGPDSSAMEIITEILNKTTEDTNPSFINDSIKAYEETVKPLKVEPIQIDMEDSLISDFSPDFEETEDVDLDDLFTYDMNESINFSEFDDEIVLLDEVDEETPEKQAYDKLVADDLPIDYSPTQKEKGFYDPFEGAGTSDYALNEDLSTLDVENSSDYGPDKIDFSLEEPIQEERKELDLNDYEKDIPQVQNPMTTQMPPMGYVPITSIMPTSATVENPVIKNVEADLDLTFEPQEENFDTQEKAVLEEDVTDSEVFEEPVNYDDLLSDEEMVENLKDEESINSDPIAEFENENYFKTDAVLAEMPVESETEESPFETEENLEENLQEEIEENTKLEKKESKDENTNPLFLEVANLFIDLRNLCLWLPEKMQEEFSNSSDKLCLDYLIEKLSGKSGLLESATAICGAKNLHDINKDSDRFLENSQRENLISTMNYLQSLTVFLPNQQQASSLEREVAKVLEKL